MPQCRADTTNAPTRTHMHARMENLTNLLFGSQYYDTLDTAGGGGGNRGASGLASHDDAELAEAAATPEPEEDEAAAVAAAAVRALA